MIELKVFAVGRRGLVIFQEKYGERYLLVEVDPYIVEIILMKTNGAPYLRPLTHDIICDIIEELGAEIDYAIITEVEDYFFCYANLCLKVNGKEIFIDCYPGDALLLCLNSETPFYCKEDVIEEAGFIFDEERVRFILAKGYSSENLMNEEERKLKDFLKGIDFSNFNPE